MKLKDIKAGEIYAYREGTYGSLKQVVFPAGTSPLYKSGGWPTRDNSRIHLTDDKKPSSSQTYGDTGYLAVIGFDVSVSDVTLEWALKKGTVWDEGLQVKILTQTRAVLGPYEEVKASEDKKDEEKKAQRAREDALRDRERGKVYTAIDALRDLGVSAFIGGHNHRALELSPDNAEKLVIALGRLTGGEENAKPE